MSLRARLGRSLGIVKSQGPRWVAERLVLEAQKRTGYEARIYAPHPWAPDGDAGARVPSLRHAPADLVWKAWLGGEGAAWGRARQARELLRALRASQALATTSSPHDPQAGAARDRAPGTGKSAVVARAEAVLAGRFTLFSRHEAALSFPPDWLAHPLRATSVRVASARHWSRIGMEGEPYGDLKFVWELSRMAWAFTLARAYAGTDDERYAEAFWTLWLDWLDKNPPHTTVQWKCGQECALRLIAVSFAVQVLARARATTAARFARHLEGVAAHATRIARGGWYARLQNNNHSMSEAAGLYTAGVFYPVLADAPTWRREGWRHLQEEAERLIRPDGTFSQKSHNYHRLMLQDYLWAASVHASTKEAGTEHHAESWTPTAQARLVAAVDYLEGVVDRVSGQVPNFGHNDGALILPLSDAAYEDFRPLLHSARAWRDGAVATSAVADESTLWLFGPRGLEQRSESEEPAPRELSCREGGIYTLRQDESWVFTHAEDFRDRPGQADLLHVDLWWRGVAIARDPGTFLYYGAPAAFSWFKGTRCHNTVAVDDVDQMERGPRFLWASRAHAHARRVPRIAGERGGALILSHDGYTRLTAPIRHTRAVRALGDDTWLVADELAPVGPPGEHAFTLHWLLPDVPWSWLRAGEPSSQGHEGLCLATSAGEFFVEIATPDAPGTTLEILRATPGDEAWGWESRHYGDKTPALSLRVRLRGARARFLTRFAPSRPTHALAASPWLDDNLLRL